MQNGVANSKNGDTKAISWQDICKCMEKKKKRPHIAQRRNNTSVNKKKGASLQLAK